MVISSTKYRGHYTEEFQVTSNFEQIITVNRANRALNVHFPKPGQPAVTFMC